MASSLDTLKQNHDVEIHRRSFELRPAGSPPIPEYYMRHIEQSRPRFIQTAREVYGIEVNSGPFGINSHAALVGAKYAEAQGKGEAYHKAVMEAYWQKAQNIEDINVLEAIAEAIGLKNFREALNNPVYETALMNDILVAQQYGLTGVPAMIFQNKYLVVGAQPYELLEQVVERVQSNNMR